MADRVHISGDGSPLTAFDSPAAATSTARAVAGYRAGTERTQRQADALNALVTRRKRRQKRKGLSPWVTRQPVPGVLSGARPPERTTA